MTASSSKSSEMSSTFCLMDLPDTVTKRPDYNDSWVWWKFLVQSNETEAGRDKDMVKASVSARAFKWHLLSDVMEYIINEENLLVQCEVKEHTKSVVQPVKVFWPALVLKVAGYRVLCRWAGADERHDFWISIGSTQLEHFNQRENMMFSPPYFMGSEWLDKAKESGDDDPFYTNTIAVFESLQHTHTFTQDVINMRNYNAKYSKYEVGQRLELLDYQNSGRVRPARVMEIIGRRVCLQVLPEDCPIKDDEGDDKQLLADTFWIDEASFYVFYVGWAAYNNYGITATDEYMEYTREIADALKNKQMPRYERGDVTYKQMETVKQFPKHITHEWKKGMQLELLDPLDVKLQEFQVATVLEILKDGYLKIGRDDSDPNEAIPLHCSSPLMFPVGYSSRYGIHLNTPEGVEIPFSWNQYMKSKKSVSAPLVFFKKNTTPQRSDLFQIGAKLEVADLCENKGVCPATILAKKGRLLHLSFDGWDSTYDQLVDIDSMDLFPIGWCEMMGMMLSWPQDELLKKEKKASDAQGKKKP